MIDELITMADGIFDCKPYAVGISCGGLIDSKKGVIMSPPNLPRWNNIEIVKEIEAHYGVPVHLQNDANACAVAEWKFGAVKVAKALGIKVIGLIGKTGGKLKETADSYICAPETDTFKIQELHLPIYHYLCAAVEEHFFQV